MNEIDDSFFDSPKIGQFMHDMAKDLWPICRSITGAGVRDTLNCIKGHVPELEIYSIPSGEKVFDWTVPDEWTIRAAYIEDEEGNKIVDMAENNLHIVGYSEPIDTWMSLEELDKYLHSLPNQPNAIPYITSYYERRWGFCITEEQRRSLKNGKYHVVIDSDIKPGVMNYGEVLIPGKSKKEILLSTYICHPSMANNELSGPVVTAMLTKWVKSLKNPNYTYRIVFIPETIGSIAYLSKNIDHLKVNVIAGYNITCVGDENCYSFLPSRDENTLSDRVALYVLKKIDPEFRTYSWLDRGSDERQYCAPGIDLPIASIMRSKYHEYDEYHTSLDDLSFVTPIGLFGGFSALKEALTVIENNLIYSPCILGEPQLGKRGLYPNLSTKDHSDNVTTMMNLLSYCDGKHDLLSIAEKINKDFHVILTIVEILLNNSIIEEKKD
jgi:aminopeptidase-like protein